METRCYICGQSDTTDLALWGNGEYGWYHIACTAQEEEGDRD